jgi:ATP-dependent RNA helicase SUPV3L1/SUV3
MSTLSERFSADGRTTVRAVLGLTNTGKTHLAIERLLSHRSGMIGLPLRLLAREVYDRIVERVGASHVALITGEEKIRPPAARYFVCTVEAMPVDKPVHFVAIDEVQLAAHPTRGHVFTDRILHARGVDETIFLGSDTMTGVLEALVPGIDVLSQPRLSTLSHKGHDKIHRVPPRSAIVAFSAQDVYAHAEHLRAKKGGCAVVLGALSPRARNAQVDLYRDGSVDYLVATDAIGMGLNLDVHHVAFAARHKFDGRHPRALEDAEIAQIAGRAGRYRRDGTFGTTHDCEPFAPDLIEAVEHHRFAPIRQIWWRNSNLTFGSVQELVAGLERAPQKGTLRRMLQGEDHVTLEALAARPEVRDRAKGEDAVRLLWDVAQIPDYRKTLTGHHVELLADLYLSLLDQGTISASYLDERLEHLSRTDGDIDTLMTRIAYVRTWTYVSHRKGWIEDAESIQQRARAIEDRLSDALHEQLTARFLEHRVAVQAGLEVQAIDVDDDGVVRVGGNERARIVGLRVEGLVATPGTATHQALVDRIQHEIGLRVRSLVEDPDDVFAFGPDAVLSWRGHPVGAWEAGRTLAQPVVRLKGLGDLDPIARGAVEGRLQRFTDDRIHDLLGALRRRIGRELPPAGLDLLIEVEKGLGTVEVRAVRPLLSHLHAQDLKRLARLDIRVGRRVLYLASGLRPDHRRLRASLATAFLGVMPDVPPDGATSVGATGPNAHYLALGFPVVGGVAVRADVLEKVFALVRRQGKNGPFALPPEVPSWLGADKETAGKVVAGLGYERVAFEFEDRFVPRRPARRPR